MFLFLSDPHCIDMKPNHCYVALLAEVDPIFECSVEPVWSKGLCDGHTLGHTAGEIIGSLAWGITLNVILQLFHFLFIYIIIKLQKNKNSNINDDNNKSILNNYIKKSLYLVIGYTQNIQ